MELSSNHPARLYFFIITLLFIIQYIFFNIFFFNIKYKLIFYFLLLLNKFILFSKHLTLTEKFQVNYNFINSFFLFLVKCLVKKPLIATCLYIVVLWVMQHKNNYVNLFILYNYVVQRLIVIDDFDVGELTNN